MFYPPFFVFVSIGDIWYVGEGNPKGINASVVHLFLEISLSDFPLHLDLLQKHQDTFSLAPQRPLTTINPISHSLHPNGTPSLKPSPMPRTIQAMPWEQRSLYNQ